MPDRPPETTQRSSAGRRPRVIGVLGGIASGKSAVARLAAGEHGVVIDADEEARLVLAEPSVREAIRARFGPDVIARDGGVDRERLAAIVFGSLDAKSALEAFTHPRIRDRIRAQLDAARAAGSPRIALDVPLLLENDAQHGLVAECDELWFVDAALAQRDARAVERRGWKAGEVARREALQMPLDRKRARADHVLSNHGSLSDLEAAVRRILASH